MGGAHAPHLHSTRTTGHGVLYRPSHYMGPRHISRQTEDTVTVQTTFLDHQGVIGTIHLPIMPTEVLLLPLARPPRVPLFRYPIQGPILEGWKSKVAVDSYAATSLAKAMGHAIIASIGQEPGNSPTDDTIDPQGIVSSILGLANQYPRHPWGCLGRGNYHVPS